MDEFKEKVLNLLALGKLSEAANLYIRHSMLTGEHHLDLINVILRSALSQASFDIKKPLVKLIRKQKLLSFLPIIRDMLMLEETSILDTFILTSDNSSSHKHTLTAQLILTLAYLRDKESIPILRSFLRHPNPLVYSSTVLALGAMEDPVSYPDIKQALLDDNEEVRSSAAVSLGWYQKPDGFALLISRLEGPVPENSPKVKEKIIRALFWDRTPRAIELLEKLLIHENHINVWLTTIEVLLRVNPTHSAKLLLEALTIELEKRLKSPKLKEQQTALEWLNHSVWEATKILTSSQKKDIVGIIRSNIQVADRDYIRASLKALRSLLSEPSSVDLLIDIAEGNLPITVPSFRSVRAEALELLSSLNDKTIQFKILELLNEQDEDLAEVALLSLKPSLLPERYLLKNLNYFMLRTNHLKNKLLALGVLYKLLSERAVSKES